MNLSKLISFSIPSEFSLFFKKLSDHAEWMGRYPIPLSSDRFDKSLFSQMWSEVDIDKYYLAREMVFTHLNLNYYELLTTKFGTSE